MKHQTFKESEQRPTSINGSLVPARNDVQGGRKLQQLAARDTHGAYDSSHKIVSAAYTIFVALSKPVRQQEEPLPVLDLTDDE